MSLKKLESIAGCSAKAIDPLIRVADGEDILCGAGVLARETVQSRELLQNLNLGEVRILKFIHQHEPRMGALPFKQRRVFRQQLVGAKNHMAEGPQITLA